MKKHFSKESFDAEKAITLLAIIVLSPLLAALLSILCFHFLGLEDSEALGHQNDAFIKR